MMYFQKFLRPLLLSFLVLVLAGCSLPSSGTSVLPEDIPEGSHLLTMRAPEIFCPGCTGAIEASIGALPGVHYVDADATSKEVRVVYDPLQILSDDIMANTVFDAYGREFVSDKIYSP